MSDYITDGNVPAYQGALSSATIRSEFDNIYTGFGKLPTISGNGSKIIAVNSGATALEAITSVPVAQGGTGATSAGDARTNLGLGALATESSVDNSNWSGTVLSVTNGGTGASTASGARTALGLGSLAVLSTVNNSNWSGTALAVANGGTGSTTAADARTALGLGSLAVANSVNDSNWSGTDLAVANGGTGSSTAADARTALGLAIGSDVQAYSANLAAIAALATTDSNIIVGNGATWVAESGSTARTSLGLGSLATLSSVNNDNWSGTDLAVANGGTGASTASGARTALGLGALATLSTLNNDYWSGTDLAVTNGGTGSSTASGARSNLGLGSISTYDVTISTSAASGGSNNDLWFEREA